MSKKLTPAQVVTKIHNAPAGSVKINAGTPGGHPADGMTATVAIGDGAYMSIVNPGSFRDGGPEWVMRYGNTEAIRYSVASLLESYDYLLSSEITATEAILRLKMMRSARAGLAALAQEGGE